jgi:hypothetical protein
VLPGLSYFIISALHYKEMADLKPKPSRFKDVTDIILSFPIDYLKTNDIHRIHRIFNSSKQVVKWIRGYHMTKVHANVQWQKEGGHVRVDADAKDEGVAVDCKQVFPIPGLFWRTPLATLLTQGCMQSEVGKKQYYTPMTLDVPISFVAAGKATLRGLGFPQPLLSFCMTLYNYDIIIQAAMKFYHECRYGEY